MADSVALWKMFLKNLEEILGVNSGGVIRLQISTLPLEREWTGVNGLHNLYLFANSIPVWGPGYQETDKKDDGGYGIFLDVVVPLDASDPNAHEKAKELEPAMNAALKQ